MIIYGVNPVLEALRSGRVRELRVGERNDGRLRELLSLADKRGVPVRRVQVDALNRDARGGVHQGVLAVTDDAREYSLDELVRGASGPPLLVVLDGIEDPHNLGAILRTADAAGADGVVLQSRRSAALGGVVAKASAGAVAHVRIAEVVNIARAVDDLKTAGVWTVGLASQADGACTIRSISPARSRSFWALKVQVCAVWCGNAATIWCQSRCSDTLKVSMYLWRRE